MEVVDPGMQAEKRLRSLPPFEALLLSFLTPCSTVGLLNHVVAARGGDHLLMVDLDQGGDLTDRCSITPQLICANCVWHIIFAKELGQERFRGFGISVPLKQDIEYEPVLVYSPPAGRRALASILPKKSQWRTPSTVVQTSSRSH